MKILMLGWEFPPYFSGGVERGRDRKTAPLSREHGKVVLFLGRVTLQKRPDYFVQAARRVLANDLAARVNLHERPSYALTAPAGSGADAAASFLPLAERSDRGDAHAE